MGKELTKVLMQRLPGRWVTNLELEAILRDRQSANNALNEAYRQYTAIVTRIDELAQLSPSIVHSIFIDRLSIHAGYLSKQGRDFKTALQKTQNSLRVDPAYVGYLIEITSYLEDAIDAVIEGRDDGSRLRDLSRNFPINKTFADMMDNVPLKGRPSTGWSKPRFWAGQTIYQLHQDKPDETYMMLLPIALDMLAETDELTVDEKRDCRISYLTNTKNKRLSNLANEWKNAHLGIVDSNEHSH